MENHQKINCEVSSCMYNERTTDGCLLKDIIVKNCNSCKTKSAEDSMCGSYKSRQ